MSELDPAFPSGVSKSEATFQVNEAFYSRTDKRAMIKAGNEVFQRVAGHEWPELLGAPHKLIRHPDMPKGVFHMLWERLKAGQPTGAYVKNRRICGRFYWVYALVAPTEDGYISTRIKPVSPLRAEVEALYAAMLKHEQDGMSPADSAGTLQQTRALPPMTISRAMRLPRNSRPAHARWGGRLIRCCSVSSTCPAPLPRSGTRLTR